jgi:aspartate kinase
MKKTIVIKFGGTSLMTVERIKKAANIVANSVLSGQQTVVVVSAMGHSTDELIDLCHDITSVPDRRELDALMATGEQVSATLMTMALQSIGLSAKSFSGIQAGISTDEQFGNATIKAVNTQILLNQLHKGIVPVVTGFQGANRNGEITTIGRGGSDTTAIALAAALYAERCDIYTDVDGVYSADPRVVKSACKFDRLSASQMLELAKSGAQVLNARSMEIARDHQVPVRVRSTFCPSDEGTLVVVDKDYRERESIAGIAINPSLSCLKIDLRKLESGTQRRLRNFSSLRSLSKRNLLALLSEKNVSAEFMDPFRLNPFQLYLLVPACDANLAITALEEQTELEIKQLSLCNHYAPVSIVAPPMNNQLQQKAIDALLDNNITIAGRSSNMLRLTLLLPRLSLSHAANLLHQTLVQTSVAA